MKELLVNADGKGGKVISKLVDVDIPKPKDNEVLIKIEVTGTNPKDWKYVMSGAEFKDMGDDMAGYVEAVGSKVLNFKKGDRVAGFHVMLEPNGSFAEYGLCPASTTFHIPENTSFEEAATIPLVALTAANGLYQRLQLPPPWSPAKTEIPFVVYGGSSAVGLTVLKFAKLSGLSPIITVAGGGADVVKKDNLADHIIDYRGNDNIAEDIKKALGGKELHYAFDAIAEKGSSKIVSEAMANGGALTAILPVKDQLANNVEARGCYVGTSHKFYPSMGFQNPEEQVGPDSDFAYIFSAYLTRILENGKFKTHPYEVVPNGLDGLPEALNQLKENKVSGKKLVARISETPSLKK